MWLTLHMYPDIIQKRYLFKVENALHILFNLSQLQTFLISVFWSAVLKLLQILVIYSALLCIRSYYSKCIIRFYWSPTVYIWLLSCPFGGKLNCFFTPNIMHIAACQKTQQKAGQTTRGCKYMPKINSSIMANFTQCGFRI